VIANTTLISILTDIEANIDVNHLTYHGYCVWPLIRFQLAIWLMNASRPSPSPSSVSQSTSVPKGATRRFLKLGSLLVSSLQNRSVRKTDLAFMIRTSERTYLVDGKWYNPYGDSFCDLFESRYSIRLLEFSDNGRYPKPRTRSAYSLDLDLSIAKYKQKLINRRNPDDIDGINDLAEYLEHINISWTDVKRSISISLRNVFGLKEPFCRIISKLEPKLLFITCCYCEKAMAAILACNDLSIPSVEFQHGAQNDNNPFLTNWTKVPPDGYQMLPDLFWNWGEASSERIKKWTCQSTRHESFVGGNLWISKWLADDFHTDDCNRYQIDKIFPPNHKHLLICLQLWPESLPDFVAEVIKDSPRHWIWHIRHHPRHPVSYEDLHRFLGSKGDINIDLHTASSMPLYLLLKHVDLHLTGYSTVAFEAAQFNVPTIFYHPNAKDGFKDLLEDDFFLYADSDQQLSFLIDNKLRRNKIGGDAKAYIVVNRAKQMNCLESMIKWSR
jgi:hypothetical protein